MSVFVVQEKGCLPDKTIFHAATLDMMVVMVGVSIPSLDTNSIAYHLIPAEYLTDPIYPGLPPGLSPQELCHWLAPPPMFYLGPSSQKFPGYHQAMVMYDISDKEDAEGRGTILNQMY